MFLYLIPNEYNSFIRFLYLLSFLFKLSTILHDEIYFNLYIIYFRCYLIFIILFKRKETKKTYILI